MQTPLSRIEYWLALVGRPLLRHGVFLTAMVVLAVVTTAIIGRPGSAYGFYAFQFFVDMYAVCIILTLLPRIVAQVIKVCFYSVSYLLAFVETFLFLRYKLAFSPTMLNLLLETNTGEASEFLTASLQSAAFRESLFIYGGILIVNIIAAIWGYRAWQYLYRHLLAQKDHFMRQCGHGVKYWLIPVITLAALAVGIVPWIGEKAKMAQFFHNNQTRFAESIKANVFYTPFYRLVHSAHFLSMARQETENLISRMQTFKVDSCAATCPNIVVVIGESYNKHHASLYGYPLETTPMLSTMAKNGSLMVFNDVISPWNVTSHCFKSFLSTHSAGTAGTWADGILIPTIFRRAGYKVAFATNQFYKSAAQGSIDFNGSFFLNDERMDTLCFDFRNGFRSRSEAEITSLLKKYQPAQNNLYLLHLYGQHMEYAGRYPKSRTVFTKEHIQRPDLTEKQREIVAHYDNATRYNDEVVTRIFSYFKEQDAIVIYFSDHGEEVYDGQSGMYGRNHTPNPSAAVLHAEYDVPFMIWTTKTFRQKRPELVRRIKAAVDRPFSHDDLPHVLMGLAGIATSHYDETRDLLSDRFQPHTRWVKQTVDYDKVVGNTK